MNDFNITKYDLKIRLKIIGMNITNFLEKINYNPKHLSRYKNDAIIPTHFCFALMYFEEKISKEKMIEVLDEYKKISLQSNDIEIEIDKIVGENCFFWNKNSPYLVVGEFQEKKDSKFNMKGHKHSFDFAEKFIGMTPRKFFIQHFSNGKVVKPKDIL